jgi:hypothetical protein
VVLPKASRTQADQPAGKGHFNDTDTPDSRIKQDIDGPPRNETDLMSNEGQQATPPENFGHTIAAGTSVLNSGQLRNESISSDSKTPISEAKPSESPQLIPDPAPGFSASPSARVMERIGQSEMHVGLSSSRFGNIEFHTSVSQDRVGTTIATSHVELHAALAAEIPFLEKAMLQHQLTLGRIQLDFRSGNSEADSSGRNHQQRSRQDATPSFPNSTLETPQLNARVSIGQEPPLLHPLSLNVHA